MFPVFTYADQVHEAVHAVADLEEDVTALPDGLRAERRPQQPGDARHQEERAQEHCDDLDLLHQGDIDGLPLRHRKQRPNGSDQILTEARFGVRNHPRALKNLDRFSSLIPVPAWCDAPCSAPHLPRPLHVDGHHLEAVAAELAGPGSALADPLQQTVLVGVSHRAITATRVQQVALETRHHQCKRNLSTPWKPLSGLARRRTRVNGAERF